MSTTLKRTSMALDEESLETLEALSTSWNVSKAEVLRRSLAKVRDHEDSKVERRLEALKWLGENGLTPKQVADFRNEVEAERQAWPDQWADHAAKIENNCS